jgi:hypothetical protein
MLSRYVVAKMLDRDPWADLPQPSAPIGFPRVGKWLTSFDQWWVTKMTRRAEKKKERGQE